MALVERLQDYIDKWDIVGLNSELNKEENIQWIENNAWDIIPILVEPATEENVEKCPQVVSSCSKLLAETVAQLGKPKEIIISLLEQCEHSGSTLRLRHCIPALETSLRKLDLKAAAVTWDWALHSIIDHITKLEVPEFEQFDGAERLVLEQDKEYINCLAVILEVSTLLLALTKRLREFEDNNMKVKAKGHLIWSCVQLLGRPLASFNVSTTPKGQPTMAKDVCSKLITILNELHSNHVALADLRVFSEVFSDPKIMCEDSPEEAKRQLQIWSYGFGNLLYCHFENNDPNLPLCYDPLYLFSVCLPSISKMLVFIPGAAAHYFRQEKALSLSMHLLRRIPRSSVPNDAVEMEGFIELMARLHSTIVYHGLESTRKLSFSVYDFFFGLFGQHPKSLSMMVMHVVQNANHSGLIGHAIGKLKNAVMADMKNESMADEFTSLRLQQITRKFCKLSNGAETDLLEVSDEVMSSLNFLICCLLRDRDNRLGIWDMVPELEADYLKPIAKGLEMSRAHYKLQLNSSEDSSSEPKDVRLMVGGQPLPEMSRDQMKEVIRSALTTFDMIDCVLCQLNDVISSKP